MIWSPCFLVISLVVGFFSLHPFNCHCLGVAGLTHLLPIMRLAPLQALTIQTTDLPDSFPDYIDPFVLPYKPPIMASPTSALNGAPALSVTPVENKALAKLQVDSDVSRHPSPQPSHISYSMLNGNGKNGNGNGHHRVLRSSTVGYIAPEFKGKLQQMAEGKFTQISPTFSHTF